MQYESFVTPKIKKIDPNLLTYTVHSLGISYLPQQIDFLRDKYTSGERVLFSDLNYNWIDVFDFKDTETVKIIKIDPQETKEINVTFFTGMSECKNFEGSYFREYKEKSKKRKETFKVGTVYTANKKGDLSVYNPSHKFPLYILTWPEDKKILSKYNLENILMREVGVRPLAMTVLYKRAQLKLGYDFRLAKEENSLFEESLHSDIKLYSIKSREHYFCSFVDSITPLPCEVIEWSNIQQIERENKDKILLFFHENMIVEDVEKFIYECSLLSVELKEGKKKWWNRVSEKEFFGINTYSDAREESHVRNIDITSFNDDKDLAKLIKEREYLEGVAKSLVTFFPLNISPNSSLKNEKKITHLVSVCAGTFPAKILQDRGCDKVKVTFLDQSYVAINFWKRLIGVRDEESLYKIISGYGDIDLIRIEDIFLKSFQGSALEFIQALEKISSFNFVWENFIERPSLISEHLKTNEHFLIWVSNSFESRVNRMIYGQEKLINNHKKMITEICEKFEMSFLKSKACSFSGKFYDVKNNEVGQIITDIQEAY